MFPRVLKFGLAAALLLALAGVGAWIYRVDLVAWAVTRLLERQGFGPASFTVDTVELQGFHAHDVTLRDGAIKAADLTISYSPLELLSNHLGQVEIDGFALTLAVTKDGLEMSGQPFAMAGGGSPTTGGLPIEVLSLRDAHLLLNTADGPIEATVSTVLAPSADNIQSSTFSATVTGPLGGARRKATIVIQKLGVELPAAGGPQLTLQDGSIAVDGLSWTAKGAEGKIAWLDGGATHHRSVGAEVAHSSLAWRHGRFRHSSTKPEVQSLRSPASTSRKLSVCSPAPCNCGEGHES